MADDTLTAAHPLATRMAALDRMPLGFKVSVDPFRAMTNIRLPQPEGQIPDGALDVLTELIGVQPPLAPNTWTPGERTHADQVDVRSEVIWLGPHEWLVTSNRHRPEAQESDLRAALAPYGGAAVDVSAQRITMTCFGPHLRDVLSKGCALDLHRGSFRPGHSAQTLLGRAGIIVLADTDPESFTILVRQSFAAYLVDWICDATLEFRV